MSTTTTAPTEQINIPNVLAALGHKLTGASDSIAVEEAISSLDHVRRHAFTDNAIEMAMKPSVLLCDNLEPSSFFLHSQRVAEEDFKQGCPTIFKIANLGVLGGCMMHTERCCFPVVVLHSATDNVMLVYCPKAPIAALEAEMYDSAFSKRGSSSPTWEDTVLKEGANEVMRYRREAAIATRTMGYERMPKFVCGEDDVFVTRHGVIPYLSLRAVANEGEYQMVHREVSYMMRIIPASCETCVFPESSTDERRNPVLLGTTFHTGHVPCPPELIERTPSKQEVDAVCKRSIITMVAFTILQHGMDNTTDHNGAIINEYNLVLPWHRYQLSTFKTEYAKELGVHLEARKVMVTDAWQSAHHDESYSLPALMRRMGRSYTTHKIADGDAVAAAVAGGGDVTRTVTEEIALAIFRPKDADYVAGMYAKLSESNNITIPSAIAALGKCLTEKQAILIASRDQDGRFGQVKLVGSSGTIAHVNKDNFARLACLCPWVTTLIIDKLQVVSMLCVKDPVHVREAVTESDTRGLNHEKLELRESATHVASATVVGGLTASVDKLKDNLDTVTAGMETTKNETTALKQSYESIESSIKELTRKVDVLINCAMRETNETPPAPPAPPASPALPAPPAPPVHPPLLAAESDNEPVAIIADAQDHTVASLKRSLYAIEALHKRMRK